jgi:hypothetical protein
MPDRAYRQICGELSEGVITCNHSHRSGACESVVPQSGHKASLGLSTRVGQDNHDQPDETYGQRRHWITAFVGLRGSTEHGERLRTADLVAADIWASAQGTACRAPAPTRFSDTGDSPGLRGGRRYRHAAASVTPGRRRGHAVGQERGRASGNARHANKRGGPPPRQKMALSRWAVHTGRPALPGRPNEAVRNSCVRGKER